MSTLLHIADPELLEVAPAPSDDWIAWTDLVAPGGLADAYAAALTSEQGPVPAACAAANVGAGLAWAVTAAPTAAIVLERRCPDVAPENLLVHRHPDGWFDRIGLREPRVAVLAGDADAGHPDAEPLADAAELARWFAERAVACLEPAFAELRELGPVGPVALWGFAADSICLEGVWAACGEDESAPRALAAWERSIALVEAVATLAPRLRTRPQPVTFESPAGARMRVRRGACCLYHRTPESRSLYEGEDRKCSNCPLRKLDAQVADWEREEA